MIKQSRYVMANKNNNRTDLLKCSVVHGIRYNVSRLQCKRICADFRRSQLWRASTQIDSMSIYFPCYWFDSAVSIKRSRLWLNGTKESDTGDATTAAVLFIWQGFCPALCVESQSVLEQNASDTEMGGKPLNLNVLFAIESEATFTANAVLFPSILLQTWRCSTSFTSPRVKFSVKGFSLWFCRW